MTTKYQDSLTKQRKDAFVKARVDAAYQDAEAAASYYGRRDSQTGVYAHHLMIETHRQVFAHRYPALVWANGALNMDTSVNPGAQFHSWQEIERTGEAEFLTSESNDFPLANVEGQVNFGEIKTFGIAIKYTIEEVEAANFQNTVNIVQEKVAAAKRGHDVTLNNLVRTGNAEVGYQGIVNYSGIQIEAATTGTWSGATAQQIIDDVVNAVNSYIADSNGILMPTEIYLPQAQWSILHTKRIADGVGGETGTTVIEFLRKALPMIQNWAVDIGLAGVGAGGTDSMLIFRNDPADISAVMPLKMQGIPAEIRGMSTLLQFRSRWGGLRVPQPRSVKRVDGI